MCEFPNEVKMVMKENASWLQPRSLKAWLAERWNADVWYLRILMLQMVDAERWRENEMWQCLDQVWMGRKSCRSPHLGEFSNALEIGVGLGFGVASCVHVGSGLSRI